MSITKWQTKKHRRKRNRALEQGGVVRDPMVNTELLEDPALAQRHCFPRRTCADPQAWHSDEERSWDQALFSLPKCKDSNSGFFYSQEIHGRAFQQVYEPITSLCKISTCMSFLSGVHCFLLSFLKGVKSPAWGGGGTAQIKQDCPPVGDCRNWVMSTWKLIRLSQVCTLLKL